MKQLNQRSWFLDEAAMNTMLRDLLHLLRPQCSYSLLRCMSTAGDTGRLEQGSSRHRPGRHDELLQRMPYAELRKVFLDAVRRNDAIQALHLRQFLLQAEESRL